MRVLIAGAGTLGLQVLRDLSATGDNELVVVEIDEQRAERLADDFDALVINGDAADPEILMKAQIDDADALVAVTGSDPINTVIAMLGHRMEVDRIVVKLTSNSLRGALEEIGVTDIVAPTMAAASRIEAALHGAEENDLSQLISGQLQMSEIAVGDDGDGLTIGEIDLPDDSLVVAVIKGDQAALPRHDTGLEDGDVLVVVAETEDALERCRAAVGSA